MESADPVSVAIEFLNAEGAFSDPAAAAQWWGRVASQAQSLPVTSAEKPRFGAGLVAELRSLREASEALLEATPGLLSHALETLNRSLARAGLSLQTAHTRSPEFVYVVEGAESGVLTPLAYAIGLLLQSDRRRLKRCVRPECARYFRDATKNASRRWCSLGCMERARAPRRRLRR